MDVNALKKRLQDARPDLPGARVVDWIVAFYDSMSTSYSPAKAVEDNLPDKPENILAVLTMLSNEPFSVLERKWYYYDRRERHRLIGIAEIEEAFDTNVFVDPDTGDEVSNWKNRVGFLYKPTEKLRTTIEESQKKKPIDVDSLRTSIDQLLEQYFRTRPNLTPIKAAEEFIRSMLSQSVPILERGAKNHRDTGEDALTDILLAPLYAFYPGLFREADSNGHVDIYLRDPIFGREILLGEAKQIATGWNDRYYLDGLAKLVRKYNRGRTNMGVMVAYCKKDNIASQIELFKKTIIDNTVADYNCEVRLEEHGLEEFQNLFCTKHRTDGGYVDIMHIWINLSSRTDKEILSDVPSIREKNKPKTI